MAGNEKWPQMRLDPAVLKAVETQTQFPTTTPYCTPEAEKSHLVLYFLITMIVLLFLLLAAFLFYCYLVGVAERQRRSSSNQQPITTPLWKLSWLATQVESTAGESGSGWRNNPSELELARIPTSNLIEPDIKRDSDPSQGKSDKSQSSAPTNSERFNYKTVSNQKVVAKLEAKEDERRGVFQRASQVAPSPAPDPPVNIGFYKEVETDSDREMRQRVMHRAPAIPSPHSSPTATTPTATPTATTTTGDKNVPSSPKSKQGKVEPEAKTQAEEKEGHYEDPTKIVAKKSDKSKATPSSSSV